MKKLRIHVINGSSPHYDPDNWNHLFPYDETFWMFQEDGPYLPSHEQTMEMLYEGEVM